MDHIQIFILPNPTYKQLISSCTSVLRFIFFTS